MKVGSKVIHKLYPQFKGELIALVGEIATVKHFKGYVFTINKKCLEKE
jgi:hypothetical protein